MTRGRSRVLCVCETSRRDFVCAHDVDSTPHRQFCHSAARFEHRGHPVAQSGRWPFDGSGCQWRCWRGRRLRRSIGRHGGDSRLRYAELSFGGKGAARGRLGRERNPWQSSESWTAKIQRRERWESELVPLPKPLTILSPCPPLGEEAASPPLDGEAARLHCY
jgi:hypothetical protein